MMKPLPPTHWPSPKTLLFTAALLFSALQTATAQPACINPPSGLVAWWRGENNTLDSKGNHHGTAQGNVDYIAGEAGSAFSFDGTNGLVALGTNSPFRQSSAITYSFWTRIRSGGGGSAMGAGGVLGHGYGGVFVYHSGVVFAWTPTSPQGDTWIYSDSVSVPTNQWVHVAVAMDFANQTHAMYVNGHAVATTLSQIPSNWTPIPSYSAGQPDCFGGRFVNSQEYFKGDLDEVDVYNRALSAAEVLATHQAGSAGKCMTVCAPPPSGLSTWWRFDGNLNDSVGANSGTPSGGVSYLTGLNDRGVICNGIDGYATVPYAANLLPGVSSYTVEGWFRTTGNGTIFSFNECSGGGDCGASAVAIELFGAKLLGYLRSSETGGPGDPYSGQQLDGKRVLADGQWHHFALVRDLAAGRNILYADGVEETNVLVNPGSSRRISDETAFKPPLYIGAYFGTGSTVPSDFFNGSLEDLVVYQRALSPSEVQSRYVAGLPGDCAPACAPPPAGLSGWWRGEENALDTANGNHGSLQGGLSFAPAEVGSGFNLDGVNDFVAFPGVGFGELRTFGVWIRTAQAGGTILDGGAGTNAYQWQSWRLSLDGQGRPRHDHARNGVNGYVSITGPAHINDGLFHHLAVTTDQTNKTIKLYVDGTEAASYTETDPSFISWAYSEVGAQKLGKGDANGLPLGAFFTGMLDEPELYDRPLTANEIAAIYQTGTAGKCTTPPGTPVILNAGFETPGHSDPNSFIVLDTNQASFIGGWAIGEAGVDYFRSSGPGEFASEGSYSVNYVRGAGEGGSISTTISGLSPGTDYDLSFDLIQSVLIPGTALTATVGSTSQTYLNGTTNDWERRHLVFTANASTATLTFSGPATGAVDATYAHLDNVAVTRKLEVSPGTATLAPGGTVNFSATGGQPPYIFSIANVPPHGSVNPNTGVYTAGSTAGADDTVRVSDAFGAIATAEVQIRAPLMFSDSAFNDADWTLTTLAFNNGGSVSASQSASGGNPGSYRRVTTSVNAAAGNSFSAVLGFSKRSGANYDPEVQGPISHLNYSEDAILLTGFGDGQATGPALLQDGKVYVATGQVTSNSFWTNKPLNTLRAEDFVRADPMAPVFYTTEHPDFSTNGSPISLGFYRANATCAGCGGYVVEAGIDNWSITLWTSPTLTLIPPSTNAGPVLSTVVAPLGTVTFTVTGGQSPYTFSILGPTPHGTINTHTGVYTAGDTAGVEDTIQVADAAGGTAQVLVRISACSLDSTGALAWWQSESNALDSIGTSHGALRNGAVFTAGKSGTAFQFDGVDDFVEVPSSSMVQPRQAMTIEGWVYSQGSPAMQAGIAGTWDDLNGNLRTYLFWVWNGRLELLVSPNGVSYQRARDLGAFPADEWIHVAGTYDGNTIRVYRNGAETGSALYPGIIAANGHSLFLGRTDSGSNGADYWRGAIDEMSLYDRALSAAEIAAIYQRGSAGKCLPSVNGSPIISPGNPNVLNGATVAFTATNGTPPYTFSLTTNNSGGSITTNGVYTAGSLPGIDTVRVTDAASDTAAAKVNVGIRVPGSATPYLAGLPNGALASVNAPEPPDEAPQQSPVLVTSFSPQPNTVLSFRATGGVGYAPGTILDPPDGRANFLTTHRNGAEHGISDERSPADSLLGVFLGPDSPESSPAPVPLNFATPELRDYTVLMPQLKQVFFIGDGLRANGSNQFVVPPAGATRLYLATTDGFGWANNQGQFLVSMNAINLAAPFGISPVAVSVDPGTAVTFTASGGTPPYSFTLATNNSGGNITAAGLYTAGANQSRTDVIRVTDFSGSNALATALVLVVSPPHLELTPTGTNTVAVSWDSAASAFELEFTDSLSPPISWKELSNTNNITDNGTLRTFILANPPDVPARFYRLRKR